MDSYTSSERDRFDPKAFDDHQITVIAGAVNRYGIGNPCQADKRTLISFTWEQVQTALMRSRADCKGDARDDLDDVVYAVRDAQRAHA